MEEEFETFEVDQQRELVMNEIFIGGSDQTEPYEETKQTLNFQTFKSILDLRI